MNYIKKIILLLVLSISLISSGCSGKNEKDDRNESRQTEHFKIKVEEVVSEPAFKDNQLVTIDFNVENIGKENFAIGASDFYLKDSKGKEYKINGNHPNFGDDVPVKKTLKGQGFYQLPEKDTSFTVVYRPFEVVESEWFIVLSKK
ncbi:DUF4352 domain-containing protein [Carnobacterium maltaromaticum]|uniref:DUF4352 domain-containing protein n=1 Tax=Carnobacterium maltaromaticum TaxID=2751 RepID=UPI00295ED741|nr:DUF4352 domain-containing protein [Carnobacterium maltaromaticum]